jgi:hypothetical protein
MVERARLTPQLVFEAKCPNQGERWIADTKIKGFGLRLWSSKSGGEKAFAVRVSDPNSRKIRRTFDVDNARRTKFEFVYLGRKNRFGLGEYLNEAREWARDEIDRIKHRPTIRDENWIARRTTGELVRSLTLQRAANALLLGLEANNASDRYRDQLHKLFSAHIPEGIKQTPLEKLNPKQVARAIVKANAPAGNIRVLRSFLSQIVERGASFDGPLGRFHDKFSNEFTKQWESSHDVRYPELRKFRADKYERIFHALESDETYWQQAFAIRLYFEFHAPLSRIMSGQWKQIHEKYWYPYWPNEKEFWFECRDDIKEGAQRLLAKISSLAERDFNGSNFWFPSRHARSVDHIRTVEHAWQRALHKCNVRYYPLREFSRSFREFHNPSYFTSFLRQYRETFREALNAAEVSKNLVRAQKIQFFQCVDGRATVHTQSYSLNYLRKGRISFANWPFKSTK